MKRIALERWRPTANVKMDMHTSVAEVTIYNRILVKGKVHTLETSLDFPCEHSILAHAMDELKIEGAGENGWVKVRWADSLGACEMARNDYEDINHIYELNRLTERLSELKPSDCSKFGALARCYVDYMSHSEVAFLPPTLKSMINLTYNVDAESLQIIGKIGDFAALGKSGVDFKMIPRFNDLDPDLLPYLDYQKIGQEMYNDLDGMIINETFVYGLPTKEQLALPYDGTSLLIAPPEQDVMDFNMEMGGM